LALLRGGDGIVGFEVEDLGAAGLFNQNGFHGGWDRHGA
jgi:hypothetical protein